MSVHTNAKLLKALTGVGIQRPFIHMQKRNYGRERTNPLLAQKCWLANIKGKAVNIDRTFDSRRGEIRLKPNTRGQMTVD